MFKVILGVVVLAVLVIGGAWWWAMQTSIQQVPPAATTATSTTPVNNLSTSTPATNAATSTMPDTSTVTQATLHTTMGDITIEFYPDQAPKTVANFVKLAQSGFYNGTKFHRVIQGFMDQGGDPLTKNDADEAQWGTGGPGYTIPDEFGTTYTNVGGSVAMANTGNPNSAGSQFFINAVDNHFLDGKYAVFGHVVSGMSVVTAINNTPVDGSDRPLTPVVINSITLN